MNLKRESSKLDCKDNRDLLFETILAEAREFFGVDAAYFLEPGPMDKLVLLAFSGISTRDMNNYIETCMGEVEGYALRSRAPIIIPDTSRDPRFIKDGERVFNDRSILAFPVFAGSKVIGIMGLHLMKANSFDIDSIKKISEFSLKTVKILNQDNTEKKFLLNNKKFEFLKNLCQRITMAKRLSELTEIVSDIFNRIFLVHEFSMDFFSSEAEKDSLPMRLKRIVLNGTTSVAPKTGGRSEAVIPIVYEGKSLGFITVAGNNLSENEDIFNVAGALLGASYRRIHLDREVLSKGSEIEALEAIAEYETSGVLSSSSTLEEILDTTLEIIIKLTKVERMNIMLFDPKREQLRVEAFWGIDDEPLGRDILNIGEGVAGRAMLEGKPIQVQATEDYNDFVKSPPDRREIKSILSYPLMIEGRKIGVINVGSLYSYRVFSQEEIRKVSLVATRAALAIENSLLLREKSQLLRELTQKTKSLEDKTTALQDRGKKLTNTTRQLKDSLSDLEIYNRRVSELYQFSVDISKSLDLNNILDSSLAHISGMLSNQVRVMTITVPARNLTRFLVASSESIHGKFDPGIKMEQEFPPDVLRLLMTENKPVLLDKIPNHPPYSDNRIFKAFRSFYAFPLGAGELKPGILILASRRENALKEEDIKAINSLTNNLAVAIDNAIRYDEIKDRSERMSFLNQMTHEILFTPDIHEQMDKIVKLSSQLLRHRSGALFLYDDDRNLNLAGIVDVDEELKQQLESPEVIRVIEEIIENGNVYFSSWTRESPIRRFTLLQKTGVKSLIALPLYSKTRKIGSLILGSRDTCIHTTQLQEFYRLVSYQIALIIDSAQLFSNVTEEKERVESVFRSMKEGVITIDINHRITAFNPAAEEITGWSHSDVIGRPCHSVVSCNLGKENEDCCDFCPLLDMLSKIDEKSEERSSLRSDGKYFTKDGEERFLQAVLSPLKREGRLVGGVIVFRDITDEKVYQMRRSDYLAGLSHDIFTPLTAIKGYATTLLLHREKFDQDTQIEFVKIINSEIDRITRLLYNLMSLSRMETDHLKSDIKPQMMKYLVQKVVDLYSLITKRHKIIEDDSVKSSPPVMADADQLEQILNNLVSNSIKYSPVGGDIIISTKSDGDFLTISVQDQGIGIEEKDLDRIFNRYERISTSHSRTVSGMGLGLYITKALVELQGGKIRAESVPEGGSRFSFTLPIADLK
ncbi:MAG: GAF domain-containing protein [Firmicutes bacterium]|nr:GAF domain-containing protein [Bacillota bacterium]